MRFLPFLLALAAYPSSVSVGCTPRPKSPLAEDYTQVELHAWTQGKTAQYWVTRVDPASGCVSNETRDPRDGILHQTHDCSFPDLLLPRLAELAAVFELDAEPMAVGERVTAEGDGHAVVFVREDGTRWTGGSKLLRHGAELLDRDASEWMLVGPATASLPPTPGGWTQVLLRDSEGTLERRLASDGRWSCESWLVSEQTLEHSIIIRRGRIEVAQAARLIDAFDDGLSPAAADATAAWTAQMLAADMHVTAYSGEELVGRWNAFAEHLDRDCKLGRQP